MKLNVLTDESGRIIATHIPSPALPLPPSSRPSSTVIMPAKGQSLHDVELAPELEQHLLRNTLLQELHNWKVEGHGKAAKLVKR